VIVGIYNAIADSRVRRDWRWLALVRIARWLLPGHRLIWPQMAWWQDRDFNAYLQKFGLLSSHESERRWMLNQLTKLVVKVPGDTAECGLLAGIPAASSSLTITASPMTPAPPKRAASFSAISRHH
jgi:hypothetical protein